MGSTKNNSEQTKAYKIEFQQRPSYLYAYVTGKEYDLETAKAYWLEILEECQKVGCKKILVEEDMEGSLSMQDMYEISAEYPDMGFRHILVAFVDRHPSHQQLNRFAEMVATNRGGRVRVFDTVAEAKEWILVN